MGPIFIMGCGIQQQLKQWCGSLLCSCFQQLQRWLLACEQQLQQRYGGILLRARIQQLQQRRLLACRQQLQLQRHDVLLRARFQQLFQRWLLACQLQQRRLLACQQLFQRMVLGSHGRETGRS